MGLYVSFLLPPVIWLSLIVEKFEQFFTKKCICSTIEHFSKFVSGWSENYNHFKNVQIN